MSEKNDLKRHIRSYLLPLFPQSSFVSTDPLNSNLKAAYAWNGRCKIRLQPSADSNYAFMLSRRQGFTPIEKETAAAFISVFSNAQDIDPLLEDSFREMQMNQVVSSAIAVNIGRPSRASLIQKVINILEKWAQETYEGKRIAAAFGIVDRVTGPDRKGVDFERLAKLALAKVVGDGCSTLIKLSGSGNLIGHEYLAHADEMDKCLAPFAFVPMAKWASGLNVVVALNRNGEILVFSGGSLAFARRRGQWCHFSHQAAINQMATNGPRGSSRDLRQAAYLSALDLSFTRTGGLIGIIKKGVDPYSSGQILKTDDALEPATNPKTKVLSLLTDARNYYELGRPLRQELGGIDGAVITQYNGKILAAGAILNVSSTGDEGARRTAAKTIGMNGLGIKISSDGKIEAFSGNPQPDQAPLFEMG